MSGENDDVDGFAVAVALTVQGLVWLVIGLWSGWLMWGGA